MEVSHDDKQLFKGIVLGWILLHWTDFETFDAISWKVYALILDEYLSTRKKQINWGLLNHQPSMIYGIVLSVRSYFIIEKVYENYFQSPASIGQKKYPLWKETFGYAKNTLKQNFAYLEYHGLIARKQTGQTRPVELSVVFPIAKQKKVITMSQFLQTTKGKS